MGSKRIVVVGGGIAGISCIEGLLAEHDVNCPQLGTICLIAESRLVKKPRSYELRGRNLENFDVTSDDIETIFSSSNIPKGISIEFLIGSVLSVDPETKTLLVKGRNSVERSPYDLICLCCGSQPKTLNLPSLKSYPELEQRLFVVRDTTSVKSLDVKLKECKHLAIIGNGGIGLELVSKIGSCDKTWIIKDESIGLTFFDSGASKFLLDHRSRPVPTGTQSNSARSSDVYSLVGASEEQSSLNQGPSLGPNWLESFRLEGQSNGESLDIIYEDEVDDITYDRESDTSPVVITTKKGHRVCCDLVGIAIGTTPKPPELLNSTLELNPQDGGIEIDDQMRTSVGSIYAAGDVVSCNKWPSSKLWFQKRLWTQARQMGFYAGRCMLCHLNNSSPSLYFNFDVFSHCTTFLGHKLILLGKFNGQDLSDEEAKCCEVLARVIKGKEYVKLLLKDNRIIGAVLIGETGLEETIENLIYDQIDVSDQKSRLLDGSVDIEDYYD